MYISKATVIGVGGSGQQLLPSLMRLLKYHKHGTEDVSAYDGDAFEEHNAVRQIAADGSKSDQMNALLTQQGLPPICVDEYVTRSTMRRLRRGDTVGAVHLVVASVDNDATRKMVIDILEETKGDFLFITPGNSDASDPDRDIKGNVLWFGRVNDAAVGLSPALLFPNIETPTDAIPRKGGCMEHAPSTPQLITANAIAAAYTLSVVQNFLDDRLPSEASHLFFCGRTYKLSAT